MSPTKKAAGIAGILTGVALLGEASFFMASGYMPDVWSDPTQAIAFIRDSEVMLRLAVLFGSLGVVARVLFVAGLAAAFKQKARTAATAILYFGVVGGIGHGLVALSYYLGIPSFLDLDAQFASSAWGAFTAITGGFQGLGNFLLGLMLVAFGVATIKHKIMARGLGYVGLAVGMLTLFGVFAGGTPLQNATFALFMPTIALAMLFDVWAGVTLLKQAKREVATTKL